MVRDIEQARQVCFISAQEEEILTSKLKPILLLKKKTGPWHCRISCPAQSILRHHASLYPCSPPSAQSCFDALVMTSANITDEPITKDNQESLDAAAGHCRLFPDAQPGHSCQGR